MVRGEEQRPAVECVSESATAEQQATLAKQKQLQAEHDDKDMDAKAELIIALDASIIRMVKNFKTSNEVWLYLQDTYERKSTRRKAEAYRKLLSLNMENHLTITQYLIEFDICVSFLNEMNVNLDEDFLTVILIDGLSDAYKEIRAAFNTANEFPSLRTLRSRLHEIGEKSEHNASDQDNALKVNKFKKQALYVDDIIIASSSKDKTEKFVTELQRNFEVRDMKVPKHCIGLEIDIQPGSISISQPGYIKNLVSKYGMENAKTANIPMQSKIRLEKEPTISGEGVKINRKTYQEIVGSLLHLAVFSRPDISCS
ncbi:uncharacterized protein LOC118755056, partial [Rhagoletis pomonella]|uniref:uncharacterized protein LOC118755056 n=1 Tax=Rhagoletis pomonella TaxID=28610 RepID=UPI001781D2D5